MYKKSGAEEKTDGSAVFFSLYTGFDCSSVFPRLFCYGYNDRWRSDVASFNSN
jgi:hypothetical protein